MSSVVVGPEITCLSIAICVVLNLEYAGARA